jgi:hypothetical protein
MFEPLCFDPGLVCSYLDWMNLPRRYRYTFWNSLWDARRCFDTLTVRFPPPEIARQVLTFMLETWAEKPLTTSALFFIPRTVPAFWWGLSQHLLELQTIYPHLTPLTFPPRLPIPIVVLYLPPHHRLLPTKNRVDRPSNPSHAFWHREQAALLRGLPTQSLG